MPLNPYAHVVEQTDRKAAEIRLGAARWQVGTPTRRIVARARGGGAQSSSNCGQQAEAAGSDQGRALDGRVPFEGTGAVM